MQDAAAFEIKERDEATERLDQMRGAAMAVRMRERSRPLPEGASRE